MYNQTKPMGEQRQLQMQSITNSLNSRPLIKTSLSFVSHTELQRNSIN